MDTGWETGRFCHKHEEISLTRFTKIAKGLEIITYERNGGLAWLREDYVCYNINNSVQFFKQIHMKGSLDLFYETELKLVGGA